MARLEDGINAALSADPDVQAIIGFPPRIFPVIIPPGLPTTGLYPCLTFQLVATVIGSFSEYTLDGPSVRGKRMQFDAWATAYQDVKGLLEAVRNVLDGFSGDLPDGTPVLGVFRVIEVDHFDSSSHVFRTSVDYSFHYLEI